MVITDPDHHLDDDHESDKSEHHGGSSGGDHFEDGDHDEAGGVGEGEGESGDDRNHNHGHIPEGHADVPFVDTNDPFDANANDHDHDHNHDMGDPLQAAVSTHPQHLKPPNHPKHPTTASAPSNPFHNSTSPSLPTSTKPRVLVVDDSAMNRRLLAHLLESEGFECIHAVDGLAAVAYVTRAGMFEQCWSSGQQSPRGGDETGGEAGVAGGTGGEGGGVDGVGGGGMVG